MVQGLKFLSKKGFNPQNQSNRKQVWEAQQQSKLEQERIRRREEDLKREREDEEICKIQHGDGSQAQLRFMYNAPPGLEKSNDEKEQQSQSGTNNSQSNDVTQIQPGDDAAAAAFRRMLASSVAGSFATTEEPVDDGEPTDDSDLKFAPVLQGSKMDPALESNPKNIQGERDLRSNLEKAVGRKDRGGALTLEEQVARFPQLKNAPMAKGMSSTDVNVSFKPLGAQLRNVRCLACGQWGHSRGDRECSLTGWNPFSMKTPATTAATKNPAVLNTPAAKTSKRRYNDDSSLSYDSDSSLDRRRRKRKSKKRKKSHKESRRRHKESRRHWRRRSRSRSESPRRRDRKRRPRSSSS